MHNNKPQPNIGLLHVFSLGPHMTFCMFRYSIITGLSIVVVACGAKDNSETDRPRNSPKAVKIAETPDVAIAQKDYLPALPEEYRDRLDVTPECKPFWVNAAPVGLSGYLESSDGGKDYYGLRYAMDLLSQDGAKQTYAMVAEFDDTDITLNVEIDTAFGIYMTRLKGLGYEKTYSPDRLPTSDELSGLEPGQILKFSGETIERNTGSAEKITAPNNFSLRFDGCSNATYDGISHQTAIWTFAVQTIKSDAFLGVTTEETEYHTSEISKTLNWFIGRTNDQQTVYTLSPRN